MNFYNQYPTMQPYVGKHFHDRSKPSILLIGESHYLPAGSSQHATPEVWYSGHADTLSEIEAGWINTAQIIEDSRAEGFRNKAHSIYKNSLWEINQYGPAYSDYMRVADDVAYCNFFLRPALQGDSLIVSGQDVAIANAALEAAFERLLPTAVVFLSILARSHFRPPANLSIPIIATPHPGCQWWNRASGKYGGRKGRAILGDYIASTKWKRSSPE